MRLESALPCLIAAYHLSSRWRELVTLHDIEALVYHRLLDATKELIRRHYPNRSRNNELTWKWAVERHGWRAIIMAIVSLEDPDVRDIPAYFGAMALRHGDADLRRNLAWVAARQAAAEPSLVEDETTDAVLAAEPIQVLAPVPSEQRPPAEWPAFLDALAAQSEPHIFQFWLARLCFVDLAEGILRLGAPNKLCADMAIKHSRRELGAAARKLGWAVRQIHVTAPS